MQQWWASSVRRQLVFALAICAGLGGFTNRDRALQAQDIGRSKSIGAPKQLLPRYRLQAAALNQEELRAQVVQWEEELRAFGPARSDDPTARPLLETKLALACVQLGEFARAEPLLRSAEAEWRSLRRAGVVDDPSVQRTLYEQHAISLGNLGLFYQELGDYPAALQALQAAEEVVALQEPSAPLRIAVLNDLANLYYDMGDVATSVRVYSDLIKVLRRQTDDRAALADTLHNLALVHWKSRDFDAARQTMDESLAISAAAGEAGDALAHSLESFALICSSRGELQDANAAFERSLAIYEDRLLPSLDAVARVCNNWGLNRAREGKFAEADALLQRGLQLRRDWYGERHLTFADSLQDLARLRDAQGRSAEAANLMAKALRITLDRLAMTARCQSERQQLAMAAAFREQLDLLLSFTTRVNWPARTTYGLVLPFKGAVFSRQRELRLARRLPDLAPQFEELNQVSSQLARLTFATATRRDLPAWKSRWEELSARKEALEQALWDAASQHSAGGELPGIGSVELEDLWKVLPDDAVLVDYLEYDFFEPVQKRVGEPPERRLLAYVISPRQEPVRVELGPVSALEPLVNRWRTEVQAGGTGLEVGTELKRKIWLPLGATVAAAPTVLVSPDGILNRLPIGALPGAEPGSYLIEQQLVALVPTPQQLPSLLGDTMPDQTTSAEPLLLLAVGNVDFNSATKPAVADASSASSRRRRRAGEPMSWAELPATRGELLAITDSFRSVNPDARTQILDRGLATEEQVRRAAEQAGYVHFATHGFFASPEFRSALASARGDDGGAPSGADVASGLHPGLLSGLVLAGANQPPEDGDDGVLTALEVAELDLSHLELAVLSACETGLGEVAGGEGVLGLQRGFQVAGARTVIASLWKVDDEQTRQLMERFYENYWRKELGMADALHEAQLWMLREGGARDLRLRPATPEQPKRTPPYYWAAFQLSGDWR